MACHIACKGQFEGKEGYPTNGLEAFADHTLYKSMLDAHHDKLDFTIGIDM